ncbi:MAG TPA: hypothetical protein VMV38_01590 [Candidatus Paceibacterota bacterium]|nr:hypothetical protein [Candidatus Paceibacterota bacterium]
MTIAEARTKCKSLVARIPRDILTIAVLILASSVSFGFGYLAGIDTGQGSTLRLEETPFVASTTTEQVAASKNGTKYYFSWCSGIERITSANKIWFTSAEAARAAGYTLGAHCTNR